MNFKYFCLLFLLFIVSIGSVSAISDDDSGINSIDSQDLLIDDISDSDNEPSNTDNGNNSDYSDFINESDSGKTNSSYESSNVSDEGDSVPSVKGDSRDYNTSSSNSTVNLNLVNVMEESVSDLNISNTSADLIKSSKNTLSYNFNLATANYHGVKLFNEKISSNLNKSITFSLVNMPTIITPNNTFKYCLENGSLLSVLGYSNNTKNLTTQFQIRDLSDSTIGDKLILDMDLPPIVVMIILALKFIFL